MLLRQCSHALRPLALMLAALALMTLASCGSDISSATGPRDVDNAGDADLTAAPAASIADVVIDGGDELPTPTAAPTVTPAPSATPIPVLPTPTPTPYPTVAPAVLASFGLDALSGACTVRDRRTDYPPAFAIECDDAGDVAAPAAGVVIGLGRGSVPPSDPIGGRDSTDALDGTARAPRHESMWGWSDIHTMGSWVIVDHGPLGDHGNVTSITWNIDPRPDLRIGSVLTADDAIGSTAADRHPRLQLWTGRTVFGTELAPVDRIGADDALLIATELGDQLAAPVPSECTIDLGTPSDLPNSARPYRSGTHQGTDLLCGSVGHDAYAALDGTVIAVIGDYTDAAPEPRGRVLDNAAIAGNTPHWTLNFLFANFVVIEHPQLGDRELLTFSVHLETVDPAVVPGAPVTAGQRIGEVGNRGTGPASAGTTAEWDRSRHLHWEIFVDGRPLGDGLGTAETAAVYRELFCGSAALTGC